MSLSTVWRGGTTLAAQQANWVVRPEVHSRRAAFESGFACCHAAMVTTARSACVQRARLPELTSRLSVERVSNGPAEPSIRVSSGTGAP